MLRWKKNLLALFLSGILLCLAACGAAGGAPSASQTSSQAEEDAFHASEPGKEPDTAPTAPADITVGTQVQRGFLNDNILHTEEYGDIHYSSYIPESYDGSEPYAPVSYTHLDVYKRQLQTIRRRGIMGTAQSMCSAAERAAEEG